MVLWPQSDQDDAFELTREEFSQLLSSLEIIMIKKYCLRNYLDSYKEIVNDFVVTLDEEKSQVQKTKKKLKMAQDQENDQEFVGKIKAFKDLDFINIRNPEYVVSLIAEDVFHSMNKKKVDGQPDPDLDAIKNIMTAGNLIQKKIQNMQIRIDLLEKTLSNQNTDESKQIDNIDQIDGTTHALQILNALVDRCHKHYMEKSKSSGFMLNYQDFMALNYLLVNHKVL